jgi:hypothetical protein
MEDSTSMSHLEALSRSETNLSVQLIQAYDEDVLPLPTITISFLVHSSDSSVHNTSVASVLGNLGDDEAISEETISGDESPKLLCR